MVDFGQAAVGIVVLLVVAAGFLYLFYSRTNAVEKTGYGALAMLAVVSIMIPLFWVRETGFEASQADKQEITAINSGMQLYAQYCTYSCYAVVGTNPVSIKYNGYPLDTLNQMTDDDLRRVIAAGIFNPQVPAPTTAGIVPTSQDYGGPLDSNQINYLFQFIRSANPAYLQKQGYSSAVTNGFQNLVTYVQATYPAQYTAAVNLGTNGQFGSPVDDTAQKAITLTIINSPASAISQPSSFTPVNLKVKVGTVITWINKSDQPHTVTSIAGTDPTASPVPAKIFDSGNDPTKYLKTGDKYTYTVTAAAYNANAQHKVYYFCRIHPGMLAELVITQ